MCAISTPLDLAACARRIGEPDNRIYERRFTRRMSARLLATGRYSRRDLAGLTSVFQIDDRITAPSFGFGDALNYYKTQSATRYLDAIRVPALLIQAKDDTFIPFGIFESQAVQSNPRIQLIATEYGGHLGFIGRRPHRFLGGCGDHGVDSASAVKKSPASGRGRRNRLPHRWAKHLPEWGRRFRLDSVGINRRGVVNERVVQERSSEPS